MEPIIEQDQHLELQKTPTPLTAASLQRLEHETRQKERKPKEDAAHYHLISPLLQQVLQLDKISSDRRWQQFLPQPGETMGEFSENLDGKLSIIITTRDTRKERASEWKKRVEESNHRWYQSQVRRQVRHMVETGEYEDDDVKSLMDMYDSVKEDEVRLGEMSDWGDSESGDDQKDWKDEVYSDSDEGDRDDRQHEKKEEEEEEEEEEKGKPAPSGPEKLAGTLCETSLEEGSMARQDETVKTPEQHGHCSTITHLYALNDDETY